MDSFHISTSSGMLTRILVLGVLLGPGCCTEIFTFAVAPREVRLGEKVTITVDLSKIRIISTESYILFTRIHAGKRESRKVIEHEADGCKLYNPDIRITRCLYAEHRYSIVFDSIKKDSIGNYSLIAAVPPLVFSTIELKLLPSKPEGVGVFPFNSTHLEGEEVVLKCLVKSPGVFEFKWIRLTKDGIIVDIPASAVVDESGPEGSYSSQLTWTSISRQDEGRYKCEASNTVGVTNSEPTTVSVYHPAQKLDLECRSEANIISAGVAVSLTCSSVGGRPEPGLEIYSVRTDTVIASLPQNAGRILTAKSVVQKSDNGAEYACRTREIITMSGVVPRITSESVQFEVQFPPSRYHWVSLTPVNVNEGSHVTLLCETPSSSNPPQNLSWIWRNGTELDAYGVSEMRDYGYRTSSNVTVLGDRVLNGAELYCAGTYYGLVDVHFRALLDVFFPPRGISFYNTSDQPMIEHQKYFMHCHSESSNPAGILTWKIKGNDDTVSSFEPQGDKKRQRTGDHGGQILESSMEIIADRNANGAVVWCEIAYEFNLDGKRVLLESERRVLDVYYPVAIAVETDSSVVLEGDSVILHCSTSGGNPTKVDKYEWTWNYQSLGEYGKTLVLDSIRSEQTAGLYRCTAWNKAGKASNSKHISVLFRPKLDPNSRRIRDKVVGDDQTATFNVTVLANPKPAEIRWLKNGSDSPLGSRFVPGYYGNNYWLHMRDVTPKDIGVYVCRIRNEIGESEFEFSLRPQGRPDPPTDFSIVSRSSTSLTIAFQSGFSGAKNQTILIEVKYPSDSLQGFEKFRVGTVTAFTSINYTLTDLRPGTEYNIRLMARNRLGWESRHTEWITGQTKVDINELFIDVEHVGAMVSVNWTSKTPSRLFEDYPKARLQVLFMAEETEENVPTSTIDEDLNVGYLSFFVLNRQSYTFYVRVYDGTLKIFERIFVESQPSDLYTQDSSSSTVEATTILTIVFLLLFLIAVVIGVFYIRKYRRKFIRARNESRSSNANVSSYDNQAYDDFGLDDQSRRRERLEDPADDLYATIPDTYPAVQLFPSPGRGGKVSFNKSGSVPEITDEDGDYVNVPVSVAQSNDDGDDDGTEPGYMDMRQMAKKTQRIIERMSSEREGK